MKRQIPILLEHRKENEGGKDVLVRKHAVAIAGRVLSDEKGILIDGVHLKAMGNTTGKTKKRTWVNTERRVN